MRTRSTAIERIRWKSRLLDEGLYGGKFHVIETNTGFSLSAFDGDANHHQALILDPKAAAALVKLLNESEWEPNEHD